MTTLRIATRKSPLALWQSEHVADRLRVAHPGLEVVLVPLSTRGDEVLDRSLAAIGGKGRLGPRGCPTRQSARGRVVPRRSQSHATTPPGGSATHGGMH